MTGITIGQIIASETHQISNNIRIIEDYAFSSCRRLTSVTFISNTAFHDCPIIQYFEFHHPIKCFYECKKLKFVDLRNVKTIQENAFEDCALLESIIMTKVQIIGRSSFMNCYSLQYIDLPSVDVIGHGAFNSAGLKSIKSSERIQKFDDAAFVNCGNFESFNVPPNIKIISRGCIGSCRSLKSIVFHEGLLAIGDSSFYMCDSLEDVNSWCFCLLSFNKFSNDTRKC